MVRFQLCHRPLLTYLRSSLLLWIKVPIAQVLKTPSQCLSLLTETLAPGVLEIGFHLLHPSWCPLSSPRNDTLGDLPLCAQKLSPWLCVSVCGWNVFPICAGNWSLSLSCLAELFSRCISLNIPESGGGGSGFQRALTRLPAGVRRKPEHPLELPICNE